jgi:uncharacterized protein (DUF305 family)
MKKNIIIAASILTIIAVGGYGTYALTQNKSKSTTATNSMADDMSGMDMSGSNSMSSMIEPDQSSADYKNFMQLKGEDYDRMFLSNMIAHHQGAIDMAKLAQKSAKHNELKTLADSIISSQSGEVTNMTSWQKTWGYPASSGDMMMDHSAMGMMDDMAMMTQKLEGLSGDTFDKKFLELMIQHHQSALNMAAPGMTNASHQEVKDLVKSIIDAQTSEIKQMQQWQKDWGYSS